MLAAVVLAGCSTPMQQPVAAPSYPAGTQTQAYASYGVIDSIQVVNAQASGGIGLGAVAGGVAGGALGNQVGGGTGKAIATVAGVVGGAMLGNQIENRTRAPSTAYQIGVRMDNGGYQTITQDTAANLAVGTRARVENGRVYRY